MVDFILTSILWFLALYGLIEFTKFLLNLNKKTNLSFDENSFIITVHNQENNIEFFIRSLISKLLDYNLNVSNIIIVDLNSTDNTLNLLITLTNDFNFIKVLTLDEYIKYLENTKICNIIHN